MFGGNNHIGKGVLLDKHTWAFEILRASFVASMVISWLISWLVNDEEGAYICPLSIPSCGYYLWVGPDIVEVPVCFACVPISHDLFTKAVRPHRFVWGIQKLLRWLFAWPVFPLPHAHLGRL